MAGEDIVVIVGSVIVSIVTVLGVMGTMWWQLSSRIDALTKLLTDNLIAMKGEIGEVKGQLTSVQSQAHTHTTPQ